MCDDADDPSIDAEDGRKTVHGRTKSTARVGVPGGGPRSPRRGGAAHLRAHIPDDERHKLSAAGGWVKTNRRMVEQYAGISIEATRHWSTLMCRHTTMLASHDD